MHISTFCYCRQFPLQKASIVRRKLLRLLRLLTQEERATAAAMLERYHAAVIKNQTFVVQADKLVMAAGMVPIVSTTGRRRLSVQSLK